MMKRQVEKQINTVHVGHDGCAESGSARFTESPILQARMPPLRSFFALSLSRDTSSSNLFYQHRDI